MAHLYSNNSIKTEFKTYLQQEYNRLKTAINKEFILNIVQIGDNLASSKYVGIKKKIGLELGVIVNHHHFEDGVAEQDLVDLYNNASDNGEGFIFQLPLPPQYSHLVPLTPLNTDVDLLSKSSFLLWSQGYLPPTIGAIDLIYKEMSFRKEGNLIEVENIFNTNLKFQALITQNADYAGKIVAVIGQGVLVGSPLIKYLLDRNATIITINQFTPNSKSLVKQADIVFSGAGVANLVNRDWLKKDVIVIDAATSGIGGEIFGDVNKDDIDESTYLCPSPKGVGPVTVLYIFWNLLKMTDKTLD